MKLKLHITKEDIMIYGYVFSTHCPITQAIKRAGFCGSSVVGTIVHHNPFIPPVRVFDITDYWDSQHPLAIANRRVIGMQIYNKMLQQEHSPRAHPEPPDDINIEFDVPDNFIQQYS